MPYIHEPGAPYFRLQVRSNVKAFPESRGRLIEIALPTHDVARIRQWGVLTVEPYFELLDLKPAAWTEVRECLCVESGPVGDGAGHAALMDEVEGFGSGVGPGCFDVVDDELAVLGDPNGLDWGEVGACVLM
jgi:hypothetical protein